MDLPASVLTRVDLAPPAPGLASRAALSGDVLSLQAFESFLAFADPAQPGARRVEPAGGVDAAAARAFPRTISCRVGGRCTSWPGDVGRAVVVQVRRQH